MSAYSDHWQNGLDILSSLRGRELDRVAYVWGFNRRWWEPRWAFRRRIIRAINGRGFK